MIQYLNRGTYFTNEQIDKIINLLGSDYRPRKILIFEKRLDLLKYFFYLDIFVFFSFSIWTGNIEGLYDYKHDKVFIFVFAQDYKEYDKIDKTLFSIHALLHELRHRWQISHNRICDEEEDADEFATKFLERKSKLISRIMNWSEEWEVEEE